jgi:thiol-disulfide isomerase/thioredoxin
MVRFAAAALALLTSFVGLPAAGSQILLLDFSTANCGPCQQMVPTIQAFEQAGYPVRKVDATREPQIAQQYNVTRFPTFVMLVDGREIDRHVGWMDGRQLEQMFDQAREVATPATQLRNQSPDITPRAAGPFVNPEGVSPPESRPQQASPADDAAYVSLLNSTVRLRVDDGKFRSFGTGTIIDAREGEALIITCGHLFRDSKGKGPVNVEMFEAEGGRIRVAGQVSGWVLSYDLDHDVALVVIKPGRPLTAIPIAPRGAAVNRGDRVVSIGCSNGNDPTTLPTRITMLDRYQGAPNIEASGAPVEGRSGGGLFNDKGQLIGVCYAADYEANEGLYAALESIHDEIARLNLVPEKDKSEPKARGAVTDSSSSRDGLVNVQPVVRGQDDVASQLPPPGRESITPVGATTTIGPTRLPSEPPKGLNQPEQAAWEEIVKRAAQSEVIIIVRPKDAGGQSEVIVLDDVSPEFVRGLADRPRQPQAPVTR